eukprot:3314377-Rhodomonas_salina.1
MLDCRVSAAECGVEHSWRLHRLATGMGASARAALHTPASRVVRHRMEEQETTRVRRQKTRGVWNRVWEQGLGQVGGVALAGNGAGGQVVRGTRL